MIGITRTAKRTFTALLIFTFCSCTQTTKVEDTTARDKAAQTEVKRELADTDAAAINEAAGNADKRWPDKPRPISQSPSIPELSTPVLNGLSKAITAAALPKESMYFPAPLPQYNTESYNNFVENGFILTANDPLSTFSIDVDSASYANIRRMLNQSILPPPGSIRIEEMINYFQYDYPSVANKDINISTEVGPSPWRKNARLVRIGIAARNVPETSLPPSNLVFLIDISGSMNHANKLPLLQQSMHMLVDSLNSNDRISIVVYAGADRIILPPTSGQHKEIIHRSIEQLSAGGATHASSGITTAYELAKRNLIAGGNNRIILASDGDFNVGVTSRDALEKMVAKERQSGVYLTVLGFGMGDYHDDTMEVLADKGNGNYAYIDSLLEARKVLVKERVANLYTLARDVKLQVEFNPAKVGGYRLLGYENRMLADEDFRNDKKDAGEIGVGHRVTALYELLPPHSNDLPLVDSLKYQKNIIKDNAHDLLTVKLRYQPQGTSSFVEIEEVAIDHEVQLENTSNDFRFAAAVAGFGMIMKESAYCEGLSLEQIKSLATASRGDDTEGYRSEFIRLVETASILKNYRK